MILHGDSIEVLKTLDEGSVDALVTDPPYGLNNITEKKTRDCLTAWLNGEQFDAGGAGFMGKDWDKWTPPPELWREVYRVMKAGAHGLVFAGSRTQDLMTLALRLAGFEVRETLMWLYSNGFPKSHNVEKSTGDAQWAGWGTALKPAFEPVILIRKPLEGTVAHNVLEHGTGAMNIDASRFGDTPPAHKFSTSNGHDGFDGKSFKTNARTTRPHPAGRYPTNVILDEDVADLLGDKQRFFYCTKASKGEREAGLASLPLRKAGAMVGAETRPDRPTNHPMRANHHPTVKPIDLMRYLCRLITPPQGVVLDPFTGSGSTGCAAALEGFEFIGIEREAEYVEIAQARVEHWTPTPLDIFLKRGSS